MEIDHTNLDVPYLYKESVYKDIKPTAPPSMFNDMVKEIFEITEKEMQGMLSDRRIEDRATIHDFLRPGYYHERYEKTLRLKRYPLIA